ncbi:Pro-kumamolisin, activation domain-containing protein [Mycena sp. CBHHK59/15]|nr:Pro-kumamolisin, activation domain-containing protein [Mycena sp. CBHHK59/15]
MNRPRKSACTNCHDRNALSCYSCSLLFFSRVSGGRVADNFVLHERCDAVPTGYASSGAASGDTLLNLRINLAHDDIAGLEATVSSISTPSSQWYGQWLSKGEASLCVESFARPSEAIAGVVTKWLTDNGLKYTPVTSAGDWIAINMTVKQVNQILDADFSIFTHSESGKQYVRVN